MCSLIFLCLFPCHLGNQGSSVEYRQPSLDFLIFFFFVRVKCLIFPLYLSEILTRRSVAKAISLISWHQFVYWVLRRGFK